MYRYETLITYVEIFLRKATPANNFFQEIKVAHKRGSVASVMYFTLGRRRWYVRLLERTIIIINRENEYQNAQLHSVNTATTKVNIAAPASFFSRSISCVASNTIFFTDHANELEVSCFL